MNWQRLQGRARAARTALVIVIGGLGIGAAAGSGGGHVGIPVEDRPECPQGSIDLPRIDTSGRPDTRGNVHQIPLSPNTGKIGEYNDCQRFVVGNDYISLFAIFAAETPRSQSGRRPPAGRPTPAAPPYGIAVATIYDYADKGGAYDTLGIKPGFNCLYLYALPSTPTVLRAKMVAQGTNETCSQTLTNPSTAAGYDKLDVNTVTHKFLGPQDYPPVARWDWDSVHAYHYMGVTLGGAWREIGPPGFAESAPPVPALGAPPSDAIPGYSWTPSESRRVAYVKGWHDRQHLAELVSGTLRPGAGWGTIYPHAGLGKLNTNPSSGATPFDTRWVHVASVLLEGLSPGQATKYLSALNLTEGSQMNRVRLCKGTWAACDAVPGGSAGSATQPTCHPPTAGNWWAQVESAADGSKKYNCVVMRPVPGQPMPGTVRWRWSPRDETIWVRCTEGCCEIQGN